MFERREGREENEKIALVNSQKSLVNTAYQSIISGRLNHCIEVKLYGDREGKGLYVSAFHLKYRFGSHRLTLRRRYHLSQHTHKKTHKQAGATNR